MSDSPQQDAEIAVLDNKMEATEEVVEELEFAVDETAGEGGIIESLEAIASNLSDILGQGKSLDSAGMRMYNCAMESNLKRLGLDHTPHMPSLECFDDPLTTKGATRIAMEGVFSAIGDAIKKVWEWIIGVFKKLGEFLGFGKAKAEKQEDKKQKVMEGLKKLDGSKKVKIKLTPEMAKNLTVFQSKGVEKDLHAIVKDYSNMTAISNHDSILLTEATFKFADEFNKISNEVFQKDVPGFVKTATQDIKDGNEEALFEKGREFIKQVKHKYIPPAMSLVQAVHATKGNANAIRHKRSEKYLAIKAGSLAEDQPDLETQIMVATLSGGLEIGYANADISKLPKEALDKAKDVIGSLDLSFLSKITGVLFLRSISVEGKETEIELSISDIIKLNDEFSEIIKETIIDSEYDKKVESYTTKLGGVEKWITEQIERGAKLADGVDPEVAKTIRHEMEEPQKIIRSGSSAMINIYKTAMLCVKDYNRHALMVNGTFVQIGELALKAE